jgi:hypothetical protein
MIRGKFFSYVIVEWLIVWRFRVRILVQNQISWVIVRFLNHWKEMLNLYSVFQKSVNLKRPVVLTRMFRFGPASHCAERYHDFPSYTFNVENLIPNSFFPLNSVRDLEMYKLFLFFHFS